MLTNRQPDERAARCNEAPCEPRRKCAPSPACGRGLGRGLSSLGGSRSWRHPLPDPPPRAGEGAHRPRGHYRTSADRNPVAHSPVQDLGRLLDALGGGVQGVHHRGLRHPGALDRGIAEIPQLGQFLLEGANAVGGVDQLVANGQRGHHGQPRIADLAEFSAQRLDACFQGLGELEQPHLLALLAGHAVLPAIDGDVDVAHPSSPVSSTERIVTIAESSRSEISRLVRSSLRAFTSAPSSSSASRERSAPSAWIRAASSFSSRSASRRRSTALSSASSAAISLRVAISISTAEDSVMAALLDTRSFMQSAAEPLAYSGAFTRELAVRQKTRFGKRLEAEI